MPLPKCLDCGKKLSNYYSKRCKSCSKKGNKNPNYKNISIGNKRSLHLFMADRIKKPKLCQKCKKKPPMDLANISGLYLQKISDWKWLCRSCHMKSDGRLENMWKKRRKYETI